MKKSVIIKVILFALIVASICVTTTACVSSEKEVAAKSIEVLTQHEGAYYLGDDVDLTEITFRVHFTDKKYRDYVLDDTMMSKSDAAKFFTAGASTITINHSGVEGHFQIEVIDLEKEGKYLAKFYPLGGTDFPSIADVRIKAFPKPEREGFTFDGWYTDIRYVNIAGVDTVEYMGSKVKEPYELTKNTAFYAKWIDNRICKVSFLDDKNNVLNFKKENETDDDIPMIIDIHYGERINIDDYEFPIENLVGKRFLGWEVLNGNADRVTADIRVRARFAVTRCTIRIEYENNSGLITPVENEYDYETEIYIGNYRKPSKEGYSSEWVVYKNHSDTFEKLPENEIVVLTEPYVKVCANFSINIYNINIMNGKTSQTPENLKSGNIELNEPYTGFTSEWDGRFDFADYTQEPNISAPEVLYDDNGIQGYVGQWCFVITDKDGVQTWYNTSGHIWNEKKYIFERPEWQENEGENNWTLYNAEGEYLAKVENKILCHIKGDINVRAKYIKRIYDINVYRFVGELQMKLATFRVRYLSDFDLYDNYFYFADTAEDTEEYSFMPDWNNGEFVRKSQMPEYNPMNRDATRAMIEQFYIKENTNYEIQKFASGYYYLDESRDNETEYGYDDWSVKWYTDANRTEENRVDFAHRIPDVNDYTNEPVVRRTIEINGNINLYCQDIDNRRYDVTFLYDFNFDKIKEAMNENTVYYDKNKTFNECKEMQLLEPPAVENKTFIVENPSYVGITKQEDEAVTLTFEFEGWFLTPYINYLKTGYRGEQQTSFLNRNSSTTLYAHYRCSQGVTIKIFDVTQSAAYMTSGRKDDFRAENVYGSELDFDQNGRPYKDYYYDEQRNYLSYSYTVAEDTITYKLNKGDVYVLGFDKEGAKIEEERLNIKQEYDMIYKGVKLIDNSTVSGQTYYDNQRRYQFYIDYYKNENGDDGIMKTYLEKTFGGKFNNLSARDTIELINIALRAIIKDYNNAVASNYKHNYTYDSAYTTLEYEFYLKYFTHATRDGNYNKYSDILINEDFLKGDRNIIGGEDENWCTVYNAINVALGRGYSLSDIDELFKIIGQENYNDFISVYLDFINDLYEANYTKSQTGLNGITRFQDRSFGQYFNTDNMSWKTVIETLIYITDEYMNFLDKESDYETKYSNKIWMPMYSNSYHDLNDAYNYDVEEEEEKYSFRGWYLDDKYTILFQESFAPLTFIANKDMTLYAKWTDVTKGSEGLVYEEVTVTNNDNETFNAYVLVDYNNKSEFESKYPQKGEYAEFYSITGNDTGVAPTIIASEKLAIDINLQIPARIEKYLLRTEAANQANNAGHWLEVYTEYMVYNKRLYAYVPADPVFDQNIDYYQKEVYPVIGVSKDALINYAKYIVSVELPLNLYFIEEGAFRNCPIEEFKRKRPKNNETTLDYVRIDFDYNGNEKIKVEESVVLYQNKAMSEASGFTSGEIEEKGGFNSVIGKGSEQHKQYNVDNVAKTLIAYAVNYFVGTRRNEEEIIEELKGIGEINGENSELYTEYTIPDGLTRIGSYAFAYARNLKSVINTDEITSIGDHAFVGIPMFTTFGDVEDRVTINDNVISIGREAFRSCEKIVNVHICDGSEIEFVGRNAFLETKWYMVESKKGVIVLNFTDSNGVQTGVLVDFSSVADFQGYDKDEITEYLIEYDEDGNEVEYGTGEYNGVKTQNGIVLHKIDGTTRSVIVLLTFEVKLIAEYSFYGKEVEKLKIQSVYNIDDFAFGNATKLTMIELEHYFGFNQGLTIQTIIGDDVFYGRDKNSKVIVKLADPEMVDETYWDKYSKDVSDNPYGEAVIEFK